MSGEKQSLIRTVLVPLVGFLLLWAALPVHAYDGKVHQLFTFLAAKQFNRCVEGTDIPPLTPLQVRYIARANTGLVDRSLIAKMFNWRYYDRAHQEEQTMLWVVDTRFHDHFKQLTERLQTMRDPVAAYQDLGRMLSYVQMVTSPPRAVPVFTARFWRFSFSDRFDGYRVDEEALTDAVGGDCSFLEDVPADYQAVLRETAERTMAAIQSPIDGMPTNWTAFWKPAKDPENFGDYGRAGNSFGKRTEFRCEGKQRCVLLNNDPLYAEFALERHRDAIRATQRALLLMQRSRRDQVAGVR